MGTQAPARGGPLLARESFGPVTAAMVEALRSMRFWALIVMGWCLIAAGLLIYAGTGFLLGRRPVPGLPPGAPVWPVAAVALLAAAAVASLAVPVFRFARSLLMPATWLPSHAMAASARPR